MGKAWLTTVNIALVTAVLGVVGCAASTPSESDFGLIFRYGVGARNELNTFGGTYTKDMIMDPPITVNLTLSKKELDSIYQKMAEIDFFNYPDEFSVSVPPAGVVGMVTPYSSYYFKVEYDSRIKKLWWEDKITNKDGKADRLRELIKLIGDIIESREEYQQLPAPTSGYM